MGTVVDEHVHRFCITLQTSPQLAKMSDKGDITTTEGSAVDHGTEPTTEKSGDGSTITTADQDFLIQCLKNTVGGGIQVSHVAFK